MRWFEYCEKKGKKGFWYFCLVFGTNNWNDVVVGIFIIIKHMVVVVVGDAKWTLATQTNRRSINNMKMSLVQPKSIRIYNNINNVSTEQNSLHQTPIHHTPYMVKQFEEFKLHFVWCLIQSYVQIVCPGSCLFISQFKSRYAI